MSQLPPRIRWTGSPIEVAIALGLLGPAWMECDDECDETVTNRTQNKVRPPEHRTEKKLSRESRVQTYHPAVDLSPGEQ